MKLRDYFILGLEEGLGEKLYWVNKLFYELHGKDKLFGYALEPYFREGKMYFLKDGEEIELEDYKPGRSPLHFREPFTLNKGDILNYQDDVSIVTTYGNILCNHLCLILPFGDLFKFEPGLFNPSKIEKSILDVLQDDPDVIDYSNPIKADKPNVYVWQYLMFCDHALFLTGFSNGYVTTTTEKSIMGSPDRDKVRGKWLKENQHRLTDPEAVAELSRLLKELDDEYLKGDESIGYYESSKKASDARRKMHYFFGGEDPFGDGSKVDLIPKSLEEGFDVDKLPTMNSAARAGSYNRGAETALGGVATKVMYRMAGTIRISEDDCKSLVGVPTTVTKDNAEEIVGNSYVEGKVVKLITGAGMSELIGKTINIRSPITCGTEGKNICKVCAGEKLSINPAGIPAAVASMGGTMMMIFMKSMHTNEIAVKAWDYNKHLN